MSEQRLTDEDLGELRRRFPTHLGEPELSVLIQMAVSEIERRRAADLSAEEVEALRFAHESVCHLRRLMNISVDGHGDEVVSKYERALSVLARLTESK